MRRARFLLQDHVANHAALPLFVMLSLQSPHSPHEVPDQPYVAHYRDRHIFADNDGGGKKKKKNDHDDHNDGNGGDDHLAHDDDHDHDHGFEEAPSGRLSTNNTAANTSSGTATPSPPPPLFVDESVYRIPGLRRTHAALVSYMDHTVGRVVDEFKRLELWNDTLFVFVSDNGGCVTNLAPGASSSSSFLSPSSSSSSLSSSSFPLLLSSSSFFVVVVVVVVVVRATWQLQFLALAEVCVGG